jgi:hypothetical protein
MSCDRSLKDVGLIRLVSTFEWERLADDVCLRLGLGYRPNDEAIYIFPLAVVKASSPLLPCQGLPFETKVASKVESANSPLFQISPESIEPVYIEIA